MNIQDFSDDFLATCVDEYFKRAVATVRSHEEFDRLTVHMAVTATQSYSDGEYTVKHEIRVGDSYDNNGQYADVVSNNALRGARMAVVRLMTDRESPPNKFSGLLSAPEVVEGVFEDADNIS